MNEPRRIAAETLPPAELVDRVLALTSSLTGIVQRETELLLERAQADVAALQADKIRVANDYAMDVQAIRLRKDLIDRAPAERVARLKTAMTGLDQALTRNGEALNAAKSVSEGLIRMVANAMSQTSAPLPGYGKNAAPAARQRSNPGSAGSLTLDERI